MLINFLISFWESDCLISKISINFKTELMRLRPTCARIRERANSPQQPDLMNSSDVPTSKQAAAKQNSGNYSHL